MARQSFQRPPTAQAAVLAELRRRIVWAELEPGASIRQEALATELGVSRLPVREALMVLETEQLVSYVQHKGYVVSMVDLDDLNQTYQLRGILETEAVQQAMPNLTDEHIASMRRYSEAMDRRRHDGVPLIDENRMFHFSLFEAARNPRLNSLLRQLWDSCDRYRSLYYAKPVDLARAIEEHQEIMEACEARATKRVITLLNTHREGGLDAMRRIFMAKRPKAVASDA